MSAHASTTAKTRCRIEVLTSPLQRVLNRSTTQRFLRKGSVQLQLGMNVRCSSQQTAPATRQSPQRKSRDAQQESVFRLQLRGVKSLDKNSVLYDQDDDPQLETNRDTREISQNCTQLIRGGRNNSSSVHKWKYKTDRSSKEYMSQKVN